jgi:DNA-binding GntR family transcriptional regulator
LGVFVLVQKDTLEVNIYEKLKKAILNRNLAPGTQLVEGTISKKLGVSRTPIRFAFKKLEKEGLINIIPNKGAFVVNPTIEEIEEAYEMRQELESLCIKTAIDNFIDEDIEKLEELTRKELETFEKRDIDEYIKVNKAFHMAIAEKSNNRFLVEYTNDILNKTNVYLILYDIFYDVDLNDIPGYLEHKNIIELIKKKDKNKAEKAIREHIGRSYKELQVDKIVSRSLSDLF